MKHILLLFIAAAFVAGCQTESEFFWYKPGNNVHECYFDWTSMIRDNCYYDENCMYQKGYSLLPLEYIPENAEIRVVTNHNHPFLQSGLFIKKYWYGMAGDRITIEEKSLIVRKQYVESKSLPLEIKEAIIKGSLIKGMDKEQAKIAWNQYDFDWSLVFRDSNGYEAWDLGYSRRPLYRLTFLSDRLIEWIEFGEY